jgi:flagellar basal-body rod protein FlgB
MSNPSTEAITAGLVRMALDGAALRHQAIAANIANIANATVPGHRPVQVNFETKLEQARQRMEAGESPAAVRAELAPTAEVADHGEPAVSIDIQAADMAQNVVHYQALLKGYGKRLSILAMAINEGKR